MRLIDADALIEDIDGDLTDSIAEGRAIEKIMNAPTIEERKKGKWIDMGDFVQCSVCLGTRLKEVETVYGKAIWIKTAFCPSCGARMKR